MSLQKDADKYFETHPLKDKVFGTADGFLFVTLGFALAHSQTLKEEQKEVETFVNAKIIDVEAEAVTGSETAYQLTDADATLFESGLVKGNYNALKVLVKNLKIETANQKSETIIKVLEEYKAKNLISPEDNN